MAKKLKPIPNEIVQRILDEHQAQTNERMGHLYNRFVAYIAESQVPLPETIMVLTLLLKESTEIAERRYKGASDGS